MRNKPNLGNEEQAERDGRDEQDEGADQNEAERGVGAGDVRHGHADRAQDHHVVDADADEPRVVQRRKRHLARLERQEEAEHEQQAVERIERHEPDGEVRARAELPARYDLVLAIGRQLWRQKNGVRPGLWDQGEKNRLRCEQDSNLRGETPLDFESNALTTRPSQPDTGARLVTTREISWRLRSRPVVNVFG